MRQWASTVGASQYLQRRWFQLMISVVMGVAFFLLAIWGLQRPVDILLEPTDSATTTSTTGGSTVDTLAPRIPADKVAISTPVFAAQALLADVQTGDRMDIVALFPTTPNLPAQSAVVVRGATVIARPAVPGGGQIVFAVTPEESLVVAHLVQSGTPLTYALWSSTVASSVAKP